MHWDSDHWRLICAVDLIRHTAIAKSKASKEINAQCTLYIRTCMSYTYVREYNIVLISKVPDMRDADIHGKPWKEKLTRTRIKRRAHSDIPESKE